MPVTPVVIDVRSAPDARDVVHRAVQALAESKLVAFPTETVYGLAASALDEKAVERLIQVKGRQQNHPLTLAVKSAEDAFDYMPRVDALARRLARRCWPGPITLVVPDDDPDSLTGQLPAGVLKLVAPAGTVGLRVPGHALILEVLRLMPGPLTLTSANRSGQPDPINAQEVVSGLREDVDLVLDDGAAKFAQPSSVVMVQNAKLEILRAGVVSEAHLKRLASPLVLFVCTGNTCRSPMAETICRKKLAEKIGCPPESLDDNGVVVMSAGLAASTGQGPSPEAVQVMTDLGLDVTAHVSQPLTNRLARHADMIFTMTRSHREAIVSNWPEIAERTHLLCDPDDVADPIGGPKELYRACAQQIEAAIDRRLEQFDLLH